MDKSQNPPHVLMDTTSTIPTQVLGQTTATVSLDTDTLRAAHQGAAWKISGWPENIAIHNAKGCACCHEYINHLLGAQSLGQINLQHINVENAVQSTWPAFINSIEIDADQRIQGQLSNLHAQIDGLKDFLRDAKKSYCNMEAALTKERSQVKDLEQELKDLKSHSQVEANASALLPTTLVTVEPKSQVVIPAWSLPQPEAGPSQLPPPQPEAGPSQLPPPQPEARPSRLPLSRKETRAATPPEEVNLGSCIAMEVDDEYEWMEEAGYKPVDSPLPVSKRQQRKRTGTLSLYISLQ